MILTAAFTEEVFFRGILQRTMMDSLKKPYLAILLTGILFGLYHFPFAYYLWDDTAGNIMYSLRMVMTEHVLTGCAFGFIYYKSNTSGAVSFYMLSPMRLLWLSALYFRHKQCIQNL